MNHKQEIIDTRSVGLGSSDSKMVATVGRNGYLTESAKQRIAIMLGLEEKKQFSTKAIQTGNEIEEKIYQILLTQYPTIVSNPYFEIDAGLSFKVFNHIDYEYETDDKVIWFEVKATIKSAEETEKEYADQLKWHRMLLGQRCGGKDAHLVFVHYHVTDDKFKAENLTIYEITDKWLYLNEEIHKGLHIISEAIPTFTYQKREEIDFCNLPEKYADIENPILALIKQKEEAEKGLEHFKEIMLQMMSESVISKVKGEGFTLTVIPETTQARIDSAKIKMELPDVFNKYSKQSKVKSYLKVSYDKV